MPGIIIPNEAKEILQYIQEMGGITDAQVDLLLGPKASNKSYYLGSLRTKYIKEEKGVYYTKYQKPALDSIMETCGWVVLQNYRNEDGTHIAARRDSDPVTITFIKDEVVYHTVYVDRNRKAAIQMLEELYFNVVNPGGTKEVPDVYLFVIENKDYFDIFRQLEPKLPHRIVYVNRGAMQGTHASNVPEIEYYG